MNKHTENAKGPLRAGNAAPAATSITGIEDGWVEWLANGLRVKMSAVNG